MTNSHSVHIKLVDLTVHSPQSHRFFPIQVLPMRFLSVLLFSFVAVSAWADPGAEPGFTPLFNGKDLTGWKQQKGGQSLDGKTEAYKNRFTVQNEEIVIDEKIKGNAIIETQKKFDGDVIIRFEYKPGKGCNNDLYIEGIKFDLKTQTVKNLKQDDWNAFEIAIRDGMASLSNNEELQATVKAKPGATPFGIRAEFGPVRFRHIRVKEGK